MIVNYRIIKLRHGDVKDIECLDGIFRKSDVVSIESPTSTEESAMRAEADYKKQLELPKSAREAMGQDITQVAKAAGIEENWAVAYWYALRHAKPLIFYERYAAQDSADIQRKKKEYDESRRNVTGHTIEGNINMALEKLKRYAELYIEVIKMRDQRIPAIAAGIAERILDLYPQFGQNAAVTFTMPIGSDHNIEYGLRELVTSNVEVIPIEYVDTKPQWMQVLVENMLNKGLRFEDCMGEAARVCLSGLVAYSLPVVKPTPGLAFRISYLAVRSMGIEELNELSSRLREMSFLKEDKHKIVRAYFSARGIQLPEKVGQYVETFKRLQAT